MAHLGVIGGGILGCLTALYAHAGGHRVTIVERESRLWQGASAANEGKVHLGHVYALSGDGTQRIMLEGALRFTDLVEDAVGTALDWGALTTEPFSYLVMPGSLLQPDELAARYAQLQRDFDELSGRIGTRYLGSDLEVLTDLHARRHDPSGLPEFATAERAVDPIALGRLVTDAVAAAGITVIADADVATLDGSPESVTIGYRRPDGTPLDLEVDVVVNCSWESQQLLRGTEVLRNYRAKVGAIFPTVLPGPPLTLVQGPFGDHVPYADRSYISWYPVARLSHELAVAPGANSRVALDAARADIARGLEHARGLEAHGILRLPDGLEVRDVIGGFVIGDGPLDIDDVSSGLHRRGDFGTDVDGRVLTPRSYKLTTAPLAARAAIDRVDELFA